MKEGRFTNCDAQEGETPAWRFKFKDLDLNAGDNVAFTGGWLCVNDVPVIPIPTLTYPLSKRHTGFLVPTVGYDNRFGVHIKESFFWAINPSQDLTISPFYYGNLGYGSDFDVSLYIGPEVEGAVVRQCLAADRVAECVRREPDGTKCGARLGL